MPKQAAGPTTLLIAIVAGFVILLFVWPPIALGLATIAAVGYAIDQLHDKH